MRIACVFVPQLALQAVLRRTPDARGGPVAVLEAGGGDDTGPSDGSGKARAKRARVTEFSTGGAPGRRARRDDGRAGLRGLRRAAPAHRHRRRLGGGVRGAGRRRFCIRAPHRARRQRNRLRPHLLRQRGSRPAVSRRRDGDRAGGAGGGGARRPGRARRHRRRRRGWHGWRRGRTSWRWCRRRPGPRGRRWRRSPSSSWRKKRRRARVATAFRRWGLRTAGDVAALPVDAVGLRLGPAGARACRLARGLDDEAFVPQLPADALEEASSSTIRSPSWSRFRSCCAA